MRTAGLIENMNFDIIKIASCSTDWPLIQRVVDLSSQVSTRVKS